MKCKICNGTGLVGMGPGVRGLQKCDACNGTGEVCTKHGHWDAYYVCSNCGEIVRVVVKECPFCHARMDGLDI